MLNNRNRGRGVVRQIGWNIVVCVWVCVDTYPASYSEIVFTYFTLLTTNYLSTFVYCTHSIIWTKQGYTMWKSSIQRNCKLSYQKADGCWMLDNPAPIKAAPETAPPANTFIPRPHARSSNPRRKILAGRVFWAQRRHSEPQEEFFAFLDRIRVNISGRSTWVQLMQRN